MHVLRQRAGTRQLVGSTAVGHRRQGVSKHTLRGRIRFSQRRPCVRRGLIRVAPLPDGDQLVLLGPSRQTMKDVLQLSLAETTRQEARLYDYFSRAQKVSGRHSPAEVAPLLYRLAKKVAVEEIDARLRD